jgi:outer membrane receptor protein involved in Fe transport
VSNNLIYTEEVNAFYMQYGSKIKEKFSYLLGVRMESTRVIIDQITSGDFDKKIYADFFPTLNLAYELSEDENITFGYNRRIRRPRSRFINPFPSRSSATNLFQGNSDLDPSISDAFDLGYLNRFGKLTLTSSIYFRHSTDIFNFISEDTGDTALVGGSEISVIRRTPINLATNDSYGFEFTLNVRPSKKWNLNANFNLFQSETKGDHNDVSFDANTTSWFARLNNKITLPANIDWQTILFYRGPSEDAQNKREGVFSTNVAFSKDLFKERASIAFNISDVFNSRKRKQESTTSTFFSDSEFQFRQRSYNLSFTYRFNQKKKRERNGNGGGSGEEFEGEG